MLIGLKLKLGLFAALAILAWFALEQYAERKALERRLQAVQETNERIDDAPDIPGPSDALTWLRSRAGLSSD